MKTAFIAIILSLSISCTEKSVTQIKTEPVTAKVIKTESMMEKEDEMLSFTGRYIGGYMGFEGCGYYLRFRNANKQIMTFRSKDNPEYAFFTTSKESLLPVQNRNMFGKIFIIYYTEGTEIDPRGKTVSVNNYVHAELQK
ncbi:MAG TPA: hypothetical protein PK419_09385 [Spirochaetota bacterium]|jgi:hypothetical protein|nr:hypothetical protein [Spirochaetota bacterium]HPW50735.1 hypothetical protein [Spirochaetota bacterium]HPY02489.1 hypothetical protein [Spirochaetota bacterium]HQA53056.1 hypothetical protein [Spirochaetota bacterium]